MLESGEPWLERIRGLRANSSTMSHAELDEATRLDDGHPANLGARYAALAGKLPQLNVLGGCCGTAHRHVREACEAWLSRSAAGARGADMGEYVRADDVDIWTEQGGEGPDVLLI